MSSPELLKVHLLQQRPSITFGGEPIEFAGQPLELFIYLADTYNEEHTRVDLVHKLYGPGASAKTLRQSALFYLPALIKDHYIDASDSTVLRFQRDKVWVDSQEFMQRANTLLAQSPLNDHQQIEMAKETLGLYQQHFLEGYFPKGDGLVEWREIRQAELVKVRHNLLDQIIQFYLRGACLEDAQRYAEQWLNSREPGYMPLQYLIWITANRRQYALLETYLDELRKKERNDKNTSPIGLSATAWRRHLQKYSYLPLSLLHLAANKISDSLLTISEDGVIGQEEALREVLAVLAEKSTTKLLALTGLPGAGKTTLAHLATQTLHKRGSDYEILFIQMKPNPDFESILNDILGQLGMTHVVPFNYVRKQRYVKQILQKRHCLIVVDEGNTRKLGDSTVYETFINTLNDAHLLFVAQRIPDESCPSITVEGLKPKHARQLLIRELPDLETLDEELFTDIVHITGGLPLGLNLIAGFLKERRFELNTFASALDYIPTDPLNQNNVYPVYDEIMAWLWRTLSPIEKLIVHAVSMFDSSKGTSAEDIGIVCNNLRPEMLTAKIDLLCRLSLFRRHEPQNAAPRYTLHSIIYNFVRGKALQLAPNLADIDAVEQAYIQHFLRYVETNHHDFRDLDEQRENITHMFELVLLRDGHADMRAGAISALCLIYSYLEKRGLYNVADQFIMGALQLPEIATMSKEHIQLLHHAGQAAYKRSNLEASARYLNQAIELATATSATELYSELYLDQGLVHLQNGQYANTMNCFEEANQWAEQHQQLLMLCRITVNSGVCANRQGLYERGKNYFEKVWAYIGDRDPHNLPYELRDVVQVALSGLGLAASERWDHQEADTYYQRAMELARQVNNPERIGYLYVNLGVANFFTKAYDAAQEYFLQGKIIADYIQHDELATLVMWNQGALYSALHRYEESAELLKTALIQALELGLPWMQTGIHITLGKLYFRQESIAKAELCFHNALTTAGQNPKYRAQAYYGLGLLEVSSAQIIGMDDVDQSAEQIKRMLIRCEIDRQQLCDVAYTELENAQRLFQHDLESYPHLERFRVVEGLWACRPEPPA